jgi:C1A family cysteine protease
VWQQQNLGSCTAQVSAALAKFLQQKENDPAIFTPSRLALYYWNRSWEGNEGWDSGASIRDALKTLYTYGAPKEDLWPYDVNNFATKPSQEVYDHAKPHCVALYASLPQDLNSLRACLAEGFPFLFGFSVYSSFESEEVSRNGICPMPSFTDRLLGGHAVCAVGFNMETKLFKIRNSWGTEWGQNGYFYMPFDFVLSPMLAADFWTAKTIYP